MKPLLAVEPVHRLAVQPVEQRWLVEHLWSDEAVGLIGGEPKCCKSFLALELAVAVASGRPCLRRFAVQQPSRVLLFAAEDALAVVRQRVEGIAAIVGVTLERLDLQVITAPRLRLDRTDDVERLANTVEHLRPRLLVLDPFVRLHRRDENASGDVAPLLDLLRELQRRHQLAVAIVHHAKKGGGNLRAGQALRGSSEFHAWGDSMLYLRRQRERLTLSVEHRAAPAIEPLTLQLCTDPQRLHLEIVDQPTSEELVAPTSPAPQRIREALAAASEPISLISLQRACRLRKTTLCHALAQLTSGGEVLKTQNGYQLVTGGERRTHGGGLSRPMERYLPKSRSIGATLGARRHGATRAVSAFGSGSASEGVASSAPRLELPGVPTSLPPHIRIKQAGNSSNSAGPDGGGVCSRGARVGSGQGTGGSVTAARSAGKRRRRGHGRGRANATARSRAAASTAKRRASATASGGANGAQRPRSKEVRSSARVITKKRRGAAIFARGRAAISASSQPGARRFSGSARSTVAAPCCGYWTASGAGVNAGITSCTSDTDGRDGRADPRRRFVLAYCTIRAPRLVSTLPNRGREGPQGLRGRRVLPSLSG